LSASQADGTGRQAPANESRNSLGVSGRQAGRTHGPRRATFPRGTEGPDEARGAHRDADENMVGP